MTITGGTSANLIVHLGGDADTGVKVCEITSLDGKCEWYDALATIKHTPPVFSAPSAESAALLKHIP